MPGTGPQVRAITTMGWVPAPGVLAALTAGRHYADAHRLLGEGKDVAEVSLGLQVSEEPYSRS